MELRSYFGCNKRITQHLEEHHIRIRSSFNQCVMVILPAIIITNNTANSIVNIMASCSIAKQMQDSIDIHIDYLFNKNQIRIDPTKAYNINLY